MSDETLAEPSRVSGSPETPAALLAGRYRILQLLGAGGMGSVYRAFDEELGEDVAIKMLLTPALRTGDTLAGPSRGPSALDALRREVRLARRVTHKNVARIFDIGVHDGTRFLTMEFVDGESLRRRVAREGRLPPARARQVAVDVLAGLDAIHAAGIVHRDLKPDNVLLGEGAAKIADFGIALEVGAGARDGAGTPAYMAPEQLRGDAIDARTDVYAVGLLLFELFAGRRAATLGGAGAPRADAARAALRPVGADLAEVVARCLADDPAGRPEELGVVARALATVSNGIDPARRAPRPVVEPDVRASVVHVRPFVVESGAAELAVALAAELAERLASGDRVVRSGPRAEPDTLVLVDGRVSLDGDLVHVSIQARGATDGLLLWADVVSAPFAGLIGAMDRAAVEIAAVVSGGRPHSRPALRRDGETVDLYLRGRAKLASYEGDDGAARLLAEAAARAPEDPLVLSAYAVALSRLRDWHLDVMVEARAVIQRALRLAPEMPEVQAALGAVLFNANENAGAASALVSALSSAPSNAEAHATLASILSECGHTAEARDEYVLARRLAPDLVVARMNEAVHAARGGDDRLAWDLLDVGGRAGEVRQLVAVVFMRAIIAAGTDPGRAAAALDGRGPWADLAARHLRRVATPADVALALRPVEGLRASHLRRRIFGAVLALEVELWLGRASAPERALEHAVALGLTDLGWLDTARLLDGLRAGEAFRAARAIVAERVALVDRALAPILEPTS